jgi:dTDP-L-rhamnose 4-epimerase
VRVLVTGGAGFIGSHLVDRLVSRGLAVTVLDNLDPQVHGPDAREPRHLAGHMKNAAIRFIHGDVTDRVSLVKALDTADAVVHLAAAVGVGQSMYKPHYYVHTNSCGTGLLLDVITGAKHRIHKLVVASSMSLYRGPSCGGATARERDERQLRAGKWEAVCAECDADMDPIPTPESKTATIASVYAATKKHQEDLFISFGRAHGIPTFALRFFNVFGPRQSLSNPYTGVAAIFLSRLLNGHAPLIFEDGLQSRDFIDVRDVAAALESALDAEGPAAHAVNVGTGRRTTIAEVASLLARHLQLRFEPRCLKEYRAGDIRHCFADTSLAASLLNFAPRYTLHDGLPALIEWCRDQRPPDRVAGSHEELRQQGLLR